MIRAAVSGRSSAALVVDGEHWYRLDGENLWGDFKPAGPHEWPYVFGVAEDIQYLEANDFDEVRRRLAAAVDQDHALSLALIFLDITTKETTRRVAAEDLDTIIKRTPDVMGFLWKVFASRPLPYDASIWDAFESSAEDAQGFFLELNTSQPAIAAVGQSWETVAQELFTGIDRDEFFAYATHAGIPLALVEAVRKQVEPAIPDLRDLPEHWKVGDVQRIVRQWVEQIEQPRATTSRVFALETSPKMTLTAWEEKPTFFGAADPDLEALQQIDFHGSLINNLLFRHALTIPDSYFYTSAGIAAHLERPNTLLEAGIAAGLILAACRFRGLGFDATYQVLRKQRVVTNQCLYVTRLQRAADRAVTDIFQYSPAEMDGNSYDRYLTVLQAKTPPPGALNVGGSSPLLRFWADTNDWRVSIIDEAREATAKRLGQGVRKRELLRYLVRAVLGDFVPEITGIAQLLRAGGELVERIRVFWSWTSEGHRFSRAQRLKALIYSPGYEKVHNLFVTDALGSLPETEILRLSVLMPSTESLKELVPDDIIQLRLGPGADYLKALSVCHDIGHSSSDIERALTTYAAEISKLCIRRLPGTKLKVVELAVGLPKKDSPDSRNRFASMTTFDSAIGGSVLGRNVHRLLPGGKVGPVTTNDQTDVVIDVVN